MSEMFLGCRWPARVVIVEKMRARKVCASRCSAGFLVLLVREVNFVVNS